MTKKESEMNLNTDCKQEAEEIIRFIKSLKPEEKKEMMNFIRGVEFARGLEGKEIA